MPRHRRDCYKSGASLAVLSIGKQHANGSVQINVYGNTATIAYVWPGSNHPEVHTSRWLCPQLVDLGALDHFHLCLYVARRLDGWFWPEVPARETEVCC